MEQKRKVKSLISTTEAPELGFLSKTLIALSFLFCFGALLLTIFFMSFVDASSTISTKKVEHVGLDEKKEVLYKLDFVRYENLSGVISTMRVDDKGGVDRLYITPTPVVIKRGINGDDIGDYDTEKFVNLLGGDNLKIYSDNISIIGGNDLSLSGNNDNATILGGNKNKIISTSSSVPNVIIGGKNNMVKGNNGVILGGNGNTIEGINSFILGGRNNRIKGGFANVVVAGINVTGNVNNIFVFSNSNTSFVPKEDNAFYINVQKGLGINDNNGKTGVKVKGAVKFGNLGSSCGNISDNGLIGLRNGSLQGCGNGKSREIGNLNGDSWSTGGTSLAYCTGVDYLRMAESGWKRYKQCIDTDVENSYKNVVFEAKLVGNGDSCPTINFGQNPCVFACTGGYHYDESSGICKQDCEIPWSGGNYKEHSGTIIGFATGGASCVSETSACNSLQATLKCNDGKWEKLSGNGPGVEYVDGQIVNYRNKSCNNQENILCSKDDYEFTTIVNSNWTGLDTCYDYKVAGTRCKQIPYYKGRCYKNHTLTGENCEPGVDTSGCECESNIRWKACSGNTLPKHAYAFNTGFMQLALHLDQDNNWTPSSIYDKYIYTGSRSSKYCIYGCETGYIYTPKNSNLRIKAGCWSGCLLPWSSKSIVKHGTLETGYNCDGIVESYTQMICIEGKWKNLKDYLYNKNTIQIYDDEGNIIYNKEKCGE